MKPINVNELFNQAMTLPERFPEFTPAAGSPVPTGERLSPQAKRMLEAWKPMLDTIDFSQTTGSATYGKKYEMQTKLVMAQLLTNQARLSPAQWHKEATLTGSDVPSYARQTLATILRAYPKLISLQMFGVLPLNGPDGRVFFRDFKYDSNFTGTVNNDLTGAPVAITGGTDRTDDLTKFDPAFFKVAQGAAANKLKMSIDSMICTVDSYRVVSDTYYETEDDFAALYGGDINNVLVQQQSDMLQWVTDRTMINTALAVTPAGSIIHWDANPTGYASLQPTEQAKYNETIWTTGILKVITAIAQKRALSAPPNWAICDPIGAEKLMRLTTFTPNGNQYTSVDLEYGSVRDIGTLSQVGIRVMVDPQMKPGTILFGRKPTSDFDPCISLLPYRPIVVTGTLEQPGIGQKERGVYSRFGVAKPDGSKPQSNQLADVYGQLVIDNYLLN